MHENDLPFDKIIFVCTNRREPGDRVCCAQSGGCELRDRLKDLVKARQLKSRVRVSASGCMDRCEDGPNVMVFPDNLWLSAVRPGDVEAIVAAVEHSLNTGLPLHECLAAKTSRPTTPL